MRIVPAHEDPLLNSAQPKQRPLSSKVLAARRANAQPLPPEWGGPTPEESNHMSAVLTAAIESGDYSALSTPDLARLWLANSPGVRDLTHATSRFADIKIGRVSRRFTRQDLIAALEYDAAPDEEEDVCFIEVDLPTRSTTPALSLGPPSPVSNPNPGGLCCCGCGDPTKGKKSRFIPGHDARFYGLIKRIVTGRIPCPTDNPQILQALKDGVCGHGVFRPAFISTPAGQVPYTGQYLTPADLALAKKG